MIELDRYGSGGDEVVQRWSPSTRVREVVTAKAVTDWTLASHLFVA
ncbi:hypothetical protein [Nocardioides rubriscoriae]|nr:hypothetical protein [Nocardioides rubriscoriae]